MIQKLQIKLLLVLKFVNNTFLVTKVIYYYYLYGSLQVYEVPLYFCKVAMTTGNLANPCDHKAPRCGGLDDPSRPAPLSPTRRYLLELPDLPKG